MRRGARLALVFFALLIAAGPTLAANPSVIAGTVNAQNFSVGTSAAVSSTGSVTAGDLEIVAIEIYGATSAPTGINTIGGMTALIPTTTIQTFTSIAVFYKVATVTGAFSDTVQWTNNSGHGNWAFFEISGQAASPFDGAVLTSANPTSLTPTSPSITPTTGNLADLLICLLFDASGASPADTLGAPSGMTVVSDTNGATGGIFFFGSAYLKLSSAAATGTKAWSLSFSEPTYGASFLVKPGTACPHRLMLLGVGC
jgi:hypothetical protein